MIGSALVKPRGYRALLARARASSSLTTANINPAVLTAQYAVRGELVLRASKIKADMAAGTATVPFDKVLECNIGNPQAVGQAPVSFNRQVLSLMVCPALLELPGTEQLFAPDAIARAKEYLAAIPTGIGAYSESQGFRIVRDQVANFMKARDGGIEARPEVAVSPRPL